MSKADCKRSGKPRRRSSAVVSDGIAHVHASFNNTIITITDRQGNTLSWATSGGAASAARARARRSRRRSPPRRRAWPRSSTASSTLEVRIKGPGPGRESAVRALNALGLKVTNIDRT
jgi:small subunit ribosomal protein S11